MKKLWLVLFLLFSSSPVWAVASSDAYYQAGNKLYSQGNYDLCIRYYQAAIQVDPQNWKAYQALGSCQYRLGRTTEALQNFNQSLMINPNNPGLQAFVNKISAYNNGTASVVPPQPKRRTDALPKEGSIVFNLMLGGDIDSMDDWTDFYGQTLTSNTTPTGVEIGLGADYTLSPQFQIGLNLEFIDKVTQPVSITFGGSPYTDSDQWNEMCVGPAADVRYLIPIDRHYNFMIRGELGYYGLVGTSVTRNYYYDSSSYASETLNLSSSTIGGVIDLEVEWMRTPGVAFDFGLGYRFLQFSNILYTANGDSGTASGTLTDAKNSNAFIDFSGFNITAAARFF